MHPKVVLFLSVGSVLLLSGAAEDDYNCDNGPPKGVSPHSCCPVPELITEEVKEKCRPYDYTPRPMSSDEANSEKPRPHPHPHPHPHPPHHRSPCFISCMFNMTGTLTDDTFNENKLKDYLNLVFKENKEMIPVIETSFKTCDAKRPQLMAQMMEHMKAHPKPENGEFKPECANSAMLLGCAIRETFNNCPDSIWNDTEECEDMRSYVKNCPMKHHHGHKHGSKDDAESN